MEVSSPGGIFATKQTAGKRQQGFRADENNLDFGSPGYSGSPDTPSKRSTTMCPIHNELEHHYQNYQGPNHDNT